MPTNSFAIIKRFFSVTSKHMPYVKQVHGGQLSLASSGKCATHLAFANHNSDCAKSPHQRHQVFTQPRGLFSGIIYHHPQAPIDSTTPPRPDSKDSSNNSPEQSYDNPPDHMLLAVHSLHELADEILNDQQLWESTRGPSVFSDSDRVAMIDAWASSLSEFWSKRDGILVIEREKKIEEAKVDSNPGRWVEERSCTENENRYYLGCGCGHCELLGAYADGKKDELRY